MIGCRALLDSEVDFLLTHLSPRDSVLLSLGLKTGFRIAELLSIQVSDLYQFGEIAETLTVARKNMKGKLSSRSVPLSPDVQALLKAYIQTLPAQTYLFQSQKGGKLSRCQAWRSIKAAARACKLKGKVATHSVRKTVAGKAYEASGHDLVLTQKILGHKSVASTISYLNVDVEKLNSIWEKVQK